MKPSILSIVVTYLCISGSFVCGEYTKFEKLVLPAGAIGPGSVTFGGDAASGPYTTMTDGRIMEWKGPALGFEDFSYTSMAREKDDCDGTTDDSKW
ncbi:unnamed protein product [Lactuca virosa]|uniref:Uncharacterized protein n=1 Tax=Lactuca virosa TaxID=75947 RepID=A0AAU9ME12_9ASTR|nr:unnamed protein product [Lactuca virosa]